MAVLKSLIVNGVARVIGDLTANKIIKQGGISSEFLKADGSVDSISYYHSGNLTSSIIGNLGTLSNDINGNAATASSVDWSGVTNKPSSFTPSSHTHTKSEITDFPTSLPASDVYDWAKSTTKPSYSWSEINSRPTNVSQFTNDAGYVTTDTTYSTATSDTLGLVKIGYTANNKNYPVQLSNDDKMYVHVPWTNTQRDITDSYNGTSSNISLSQKGGKNLYDTLYNALVNGYASSAGSSEYSKKLLINVYSNSDKLPSDFDNRRITGWVNDSTGLSGSTLWSGITVKGGEDENYSSWQLAGNASKPFGDHYGLFFREAATKNTWRDWLEIITTKNIGDQTVSTAKVLSENDSIKLYAQNNNQLNFGGTNNSTIIYFGYQTTDSRAIPTNFVFGGSTGAATLTANGFIKNGSSNSDVLLGGGGHKAESSLSVSHAKSADTSSHVAVSTNISSTSYCILFHNGNDIYSNETLTVTPNNGNVSSSGHFYANSDIRYKNVIESYYSLSDKIAQLPIIKYKWTDRNDDSVHIGSSAQSVMSIIPELVSYDNNIDFYSLDYATLGAIAGISACKEVEILKQKIKELEQEIIILKSKYNG